MTPRGALTVCLLAFGAGWGLMQPLNKVAVEGGFQPFTIMLWQALVTLGLAGAIVIARGRRLPQGRAQWAVAAQIALLGTLVPHFATYTAVDHLPAGLMAIIMATIPIFALPIGIAMGRDRAGCARLLGLALGIGAVAIIALSRGEVAGGAGWAIAVALIAPLCYALNSNLLAAWGMAGLDPIRAFLGAAVLMLPIAGVLAVATGQQVVLFGPGQGMASAAILAIAGGHTLIYAGFLWLVGRAGAVFASQTAYLVTGFGVFWSALLLGERYPLAVLVAGAMMLAGMMLVRPADERPEVRQ